MYYPNSIEKLCYEEDHIQQVLTEIEANFGDYFERYLKTEAGTRISGDVFRGISTEIGATQIRLRQEATDDKRKYINIIEESITDFERDRDSYLNIMDPDALDEHEDDPSNFKNSVLRNDCPIIRMTLKNKKAKELDKCLIVESTSEKISQEIMESIDKYVMDRREYKHKLLDYLVYLLDEDISSIQLHQEIGRYLGVPKHSLNLIYSTSKGDKVRSKSEVIIANLLFQNGIEYKYEEPLCYNENDPPILPDFTIYLSNGKKTYWEHLGMMGTEDYDKRWLKKLKIYNAFYPGMMVRTYEGASLTDAAISIINNMKAERQEEHGV